MVDLFTGILGLGEKDKQQLVERIHTRYLDMRFDQNLDFRRVLNKIKTPLLIVHDADARIIPINQRNALTVALANATPYTTKVWGISVYCGMLA